MQGAGRESVHASSQVTEESCPNSFRVVGEVDQSEASFPYALLRCVSWHVMIDGCVIFDKRTLHIIIDELKWKTINEMK